MVLKPLVPLIFLLVLGLYGIKCDVESNSTAFNATSESDSTKSNAKSKSNSTESNDRSQSNNAKSNARSESNNTKSNTRSESNSIESNARSESNSTKSNARSQFNSTKSYARSGYTNTKSNARSQFNSTKSYARSGSNNTKSNAKSESNSKKTNAKSESNTKKTNAKSESNSKKSNATSESNNKKSNVKSESNSKKSNATSESNSTATSARSLALSGAETVASGAFQIVSQFVRALAFTNPLTIFSILKIIPPILKRFWRVGQVAGFPLFAIPFEVIDLIRDILFFTSFDPESVSLQVYDQQFSRYRSFSMSDVSYTTNKLFFITHGWMQDTYYSDWMYDMADALLVNYPDSTVVFVDWGADAYKYLYPLSAYRTKAVGEVVAKSILELEHRYDFVMNKIVLIGYGMGAHVFGMTGKYIKTYSKHILPLIIGLDPAGYLFQNSRSSNRIAASDAEVVMILHTSGDVGFTKDCGSIDFYANGGSDQPGCDEWNVLCHHRRSIELFTNALINPGYFKAKSCDSQEAYENNLCSDEGVYFGNIQETKPGRYYFETTDRLPFFVNVSSSWTVWGFVQTVRGIFPLSI